MMVLAAPVVLACIQVMGAMYTDFMVPSQEAPPTTTSGESSYGYPWEWSYAMPETTDKSQFYVLMGHAFSPLQIEQFCADAKFIYEKYKPVNYWFANEVQEISMYDKLQNLYQDFETMIAFFPYFWQIWAIMLNRVVNIVFLKFFGQSGLELLVIKFFLRLTRFFLKLFELMLYLLWGYWG